MNEVLTSVVAVVVVLGIMILVHELGHFFAAKLFGVRVEIFSIGFGPRLWGRRRGPTDYRVSALPLGGYVKMAGDNPSEERKGEPDEFLSKPRWQRAIIAAAGPAMNLLMAVVLLAGMFLAAGIPYPAYLAWPVEVAAMPKKVAAGSSLQAGDRVVEINGIQNPTWEQAQEQVTQAKPGSELRVVAERGGEEFSTTVTINDAREVDAALGYPRIPAVVDVVAPGMPAERAGLKPGDEIVALNGEPVRTWPQLVEGIRGSNGQPVDMTVRRGERQIVLRIRPVQAMSGRGEVVWQIGMTNRFDVRYKRLGVGEAVEQGVATSIGVGRQIFAVVGQLFVGKVSLRQLQGVVGIARESGQAAQRGALDFVNLMAVISLNLAILNLLPIPILDGGHILLLTVEGLIRRDLSATLKERFVQVGLVFLLVIFVIVMYNDVLKLLPK